MIPNEYDIPEDWTIEVEDGISVSLGDALATLDEASITAQHAGQVRMKAVK